MSVRIVKIWLLIVIAALFAAASVWAQAPKQNWKDRAEYDLYEGVTKATDNNKKIELLNTWKQKYPTTEFNMERLQLFLLTYNALNQPERVLETGGEILAVDPKNLSALYLMTLNGIRLPKPTAEQLAVVQKAARTLTANLDALKPAATPDAEWNKGKPDILAMGYMTLGWISMQQKSYEPAEKEFTECLKANPNNGQVSYWLGTVILLQKNPDKQSAGFYHIARAATYAGPGAYPEASRKAASDYLTKAYTSFHGSAEGLDEIRKTAEAQAFPSSDIKILSKAEIDLQKEEEFKKANPMVALWQTVKTELTGANGASYFDSSVKGALLPGGVNGVTKFKCKLVAAKPPKNPKELVVSIGEAETAEATLVFEEALTGSAPVGHALEFEGAPSAFTASPYMLTFEVDNDKLTGWPVAAPPAGKKGAAPPAGKKAAVPPATKK